MSSEKYITHPGALQQATTADLMRPALDDPDTISISIWRRSRPSAFWFDVNGKPLGEHHPLKDDPRLGPELDLASNILRALANSYAAQAAARLESAP